MDVSANKCIEIGIDPEAMKLRPRDIALGGD
jgi:hypothetical protein